MSGDSLVGIPNIDFALLVATAFATGIVSGLAGAVGGMILLAVMAQRFPPTLLVPMHGVVQLASNSSRMLIHRRDLKWPIIIQGVVGAALGALIGSQFLISFPERLFQAIIAAFILLITWLPKFKNAPRFHGKYFVLGAGVTFLSLFVGAVGTLIAPFFLRENFTKEEIIGNQAAFQTITHLFKVFAFVAIGFAIGPYFPVVATMIVATISGNWLAKHVLHQIPDEKFRWILKGVLTVLALRLAWMAWWG